MQIFPCAVQRRQMELNILDRNMEIKKIIERA